MTRPNESVFPTHDFPESGLTKREEFAKAAMQGILTRFWSCRESLRRMGVGFGWYKFHALPA